MSNFDTYIRQQPHPLYTYISAALSLLYNPSSSSSLDPTLTKQLNLNGGANEVLTSFQSRNRRLNQKRQTAQIALKKALAASLPPPPCAFDTPDPADLKALLASASTSTYEVCLLLLSPDNNETSDVSRIFSAQTILKRSMGMDVEEVIDVNTIPISQPHDSQSLASEFEKHCDSILHLTRLLMSVTLAGNGIDSPLIRTMGMAISSMSVRLLHVVWVEQRRASNSNSNTNSNPNALSFQPHHPLLNFKSLSNLINSLFLNPSSQSQIKTPIQSHSLKISLLSTISFIPDVLCGELGGRKLSIDPLYLVCLYNEVSSDECQSLITGTASSAVAVDDGESAELLYLLYFHVMRLCERWATWIPLTRSFINKMVPLGMNVLGNTTNAKLRDAVFLFLIAIFDGDDSQSTNDDIPNEKKNNNTQQQQQQSKKAKDRAEPKFSTQDRVTASLLSAQISINQLHHLIPGTNPECPGGSAINCITSAANACLPFLCYQLLNSTSTNLNQNQNHTVEDLTMAASLFSGIATSFKAITQSPHCSIRALVYNPISSFAEGLVKVTSTRSNDVFFNGAVEFVTHAAMNLCGHCVYDDAYFLDFENEYDDELEVERNDVRDLMRTVGMNGRSLLFMLMQCEGVIKRTKETVLDETSVHALSAFAKNLLLTVSNVKEFDRSDNNANHNNPSPDELQQLHQSVQIIDTALSCQTQALKYCIDKINHTDTDTDATFNSTVIVVNLHQHFQAFRVTSLASSVFAVFCNALFAIDVTSLPFPTTFLTTAANLVALSMEFACLSTLRVKEFPQNVHNLDAFIGVRESEVSGAFHSPGGEDHLGCIVLYRMCCEHGQCASIMAECGLEKMLNVHQYMYVIEQRQNGGMVATSKSRRLILKSIGKVCMISNKYDILKALVEERIAIMNEVLTNTSANTSNNGESAGKKMFRLCEAVLDVSEFDVTVINGNMDKILSLAQAVVWGYECACACVVDGNGSGNSNTNFSHEVAVQWARLRGAFLRLLNSACDRAVRGSLVAQKVSHVDRERESSNKVKYGLSREVLEMALAIINKEAETALVTLKSRLISTNTSTSISTSTSTSTTSSSAFTIFDSALIGSNMIEAGAFSDLVCELAEGDMLAEAFVCSAQAVCRLLSFHLDHGFIEMMSAMRRNNNNKNNNNTNNNSNNAHRANASVNASAAGSDFEDPRLAIGECFFRTARRVIDAFSHTFNGADERLVNIMASLVQIVVMEWVHTDTNNAAGDNNDKNSKLNEAVGMDYDDAVTLSIFDFLTVALTHPRILQKMSTLMSHSSPINSQLTYGNSLAQYTDVTGNDDLCRLVTGIGLVMAAMLNSASCKAPWVIEFMPTIFESLFKCTGDGTGSGNVRLYEASLIVGIECGLRSKTTNKTQVYSGRYIPNLRAVSLNDLKSGVVNAAKEDNKQAWHKVKSVMKLACGGKKKGSGFKLKPSKRLFSCERI